jgi:heme oxygenase
VTYDSERIMDLLKEATDEQHRDAERRQLQRDMVKGRLSTDRYAAWLGQMYVLHRCLWTEIDRHRADHPQLADIVRDEGLHVRHLQFDLERLGADTAAVEVLPATARAVEEIRAAAAADPYSLLGYNYVLEGSMNGNRYIARALAHALDVPAVAYLDPYGEEQRPTWLAYRERMNGAGFDTAQADRMVRAAQDMFTFVAEMSDAVMEVPLPA